MRLKMMMRFRAHFYKSALILVLLLFACSKNGNMSFCVIPEEGKDASECGTVFTIGEFRAIISLKEPFGKERVIYSIFDIDSGSETAEEIVTVDVDPDAMSAFADIGIYNSGRYRITVTTVDGTKLAEGEVETREE
ncbi:MAG: hypothetical protein JXK07_11815 [Spirochaetes bacterium]|nr:hypothetical protein [Spirochaetota bacterium]MBN2769921.1 hypothetical protein [Spirochaetota bacterium]